jgi:hypothetical protein
MPDELAVVALGRQRNQTGVSSVMELKAVEKLPQRRAMMLVSTAAFKVQT